MCLLRAQRSWCCNIHVFHIKRGQLCDQLLIFHAVGGDVEVDLAQKELFVRYVVMATHASISVILSINKRQQNI